MDSALSGANVLNIRTKENENILSYGLDFQSSDAPAPIAEYFERGLRGAGLSVQTRNPTATESNLHAESTDHKRIIDVGIDGTPAGYPRDRRGTRAIVAQGQ